ncbi:hypothetical protein AAFP30_16390 [Gordonia sp. CPCC 205515]|uniref:hypothetical protein n=1 Tax=Gordonia sp. CPCC 205515 TaxID=3140791 RepID=UPI003AF37601
MVEPPEGSDEQQPSDADSADAEPSRYRPTSAQWTVAGAIVAFGVGFGLYHFLKDSGLGQSAALYVGIPIVLAVILTLSSPARKPAGMALKVTTILLLLSIPVLGEGACCVLLAAPIFYLFVYVGVTVVARARERRQPGPAAFVLPALLVLMALEGTASWLTVPGDATVSASRVVDLPADRVGAALAAPLRFDSVAPGGVLAIGFPAPVADSGGGLEVGAQRVIRFSGAHHRHGPMAQHHWGTVGSALTLAVSARTPTSVTFTPVGDTTPIATWLRWRQIRVSWEAADAGHTRVRWELGYTRLLSPAWYFDPIERVVTSRAADYLIRTVDVSGAQRDSMSHAGHS